MYQSLQKLANNTLKLFNKIRDHFPQVGKNLILSEIKKPGRLVILEFLAGYEKKKQDTKTKTFFFCNLKSCKHEVRKIKMMLLRVVFAGT